MTTELMRKYLDIINEQVTNISEEIGISTQVDIIKDLGDDFYLASFKDTKQQGVLDQSKEIFITYKNGQFTSHQVRGGQITSQSPINIGPMTQSAFDKSGITILKGPGINPGNRPTPADTFAQPNFPSISADSSSGFTPKSK